MILNEKFVFSSTEAAKFIMQSAKNIPDENFIIGLFDYFQEKLPRIDHKRFMGYLDAYMQFRLSAEAKKSLEPLEASYQDLHSKLAILEAEHKKSIATFNADINASKTASEETAKTNQASFDKQRESLNEKFNLEMKKWNEKIASLEDLYEQKLTLEKPLTIWKKQTRSYRIQGWIFMALATAVAVFAIYILSQLLYGIPVDVLSLKLESLNLNTIRGALITITIMSILIFFINIFVKFAVSSFHLSRDAEERRQLAYQFLAMLKNKALDSSGLKEIVLQSLFSRADTGLLKGAQHIQMPSAADLHPKG